MAKKIASAPAAAAAAPTAPAAADVAAVVDAAKVSDTPASDDEAKALELAGAAEGFEAAGAAAEIAGAPELPALSALDSARAEAQAQATAENESPVAPERFRVVEYPAVIRVLNNSRVSLAEKVSGAYIAAGGSATLTLHDEDHSYDVAKSLAELVEANHIDPALIVVQPA